MVPSMLPARSCHGEGLASSLQPPGRQLRGPPGGSLLPATAAIIDAVAVRTAYAAATAAAPEGESLAVHGHPAVQECFVGHRQLSSYGGLVGHGYPIGHRGASSSGCTLSYADASPSKVTSFVTGPSPSTGASPDMGASPFISTTGAKPALVSGDTGKWPPPALAADAVPPRNEARTDSSVAMAVPLQLLSLVLVLRHPPTNARSWIPIVIVWVLTKFQVMSDFFQSFYFVSSI